VNYPHTNNLNISVKRVRRRPKQRLNKTEVKVLEFLWGKESAGERDYSTYSSDPHLLRFTKKDQSTCTRALRHLEELEILASTHPKPFRGGVILYHILYPKFGLVKKLLGKAQGDLLNLYFQIYMRKTQNPIPSWRLARQFNISKRSAQRRLHELEKQGVVHKTFKVRRRRNGRWRKYSAWGLTRGQKPITHWMEENEFACSVG